MSTPRTIDLNSDLGESFGAYRIGADAELLRLVSSANVACGFHGGDPRVIEKTVRDARHRGVAVGAHPGLPDLVGFGRRHVSAAPDEVRTDTIYQLGALAAFCKVAGVRLQHVKPHGALSNLLHQESALADAVVAAIVAFDPELLVFAMPGSALLASANAAGLRVVPEGYADRAYNADGSLVSRQHPDALITDPELAAERTLRMVHDARVTAIDGTDILMPVGTVCVHSDTPGAAEIVKAVREKLTAAGLEIRAPSQA